MQINLDNLSLIIKTMLATIGIVSVVVLSYFAGALVAPQTKLQTPAIKARTFELSASLPVIPEISPTTVQLKPKPKQTISTGKEIDSVQDSELTNEFSYGELTTAPTPTTYYIPQSIAEKPIVVPSQSPTPVREIVTEMSSINNETRLTQNRTSTYPNYTPNYGTGSSSSSEYVNGYTRRNGTYVSGYYRTRRDSTKSNNYSTKGNINPYTGKRGTRKR